MFDSCLEPVVNAHVRRFTHFIASFFAVTLCLPKQQRYVEKGSLLNSSFLWSPHAFYHFRKGDCDIYFRFTNCNVHLLQAVVVCLDYKHLKLNIFEWYLYSSMIYNIYCMKNIAFSTVRVQSWSVTTKQYLTPNCQYSSLILNKILWSHFILRSNSQF